MYDSSSIKFKAPMIKGQSYVIIVMHTYLLVETITITAEGDDDAGKKADKRNKEITFKSCAPFTECISNANNTQIDHAKDIDVVWSMYNLIEYSNNCSKTSGSLWHYYTDELNDNLTESEPFKSKSEKIGEKPCWWQYKNCWNSCPIKIIMQFLENSRNTINQLRTYSRFNLL